MDLNVFELTAYTLTVPSPKSSSSILTIDGFLPVASSSAVGITDEFEFKLDSGLGSAIISSLVISFIGTLTSTGFSLESRVPIKVKSAFAPAILGIRIRISRTVCPRSLECIPLKATV